MYWLYLVKNRNIFRGQSTALVCKYNNFFFRRSVFPRHPFLFYLFFVFTDWWCGSLSTKYISVFN